VYCVLHCLLYIVYCIVYCILCIALLNAYCVLHCLLHFFCLLLCHNWAITKVDLWGVKRKLCLNVCFNMPGVFLAINEYSVKVFHYTLNLDIYLCRTQLDIFKTNSPAWESFHYTCWVTSVDFNWHNFLRSSTPYPRYF